MTCEACGRQGRHGVRWAACCSTCLDDGAITPTMQRILTANIKRNLNARVISTRRQNRVSRAALNKERFHDSADPE